MLLVSAYFFQNSKKIDTPYLVIKKAFTTNDKELLKKAIKELDRSSSEEFSKYIEFIFSEGLDSSNEAWEMRRLYVRFNETHMPILLPYLKSQDAIKANLATYFLVAIGDPAYESLVNTISQSEPDGAIARTVIDAVLSSNIALSHSNKLTLFHIAYEKVGCYAPVILNTIYALKDFSSKGHEIIRSCLDNSYVSHYAAMVVAKSYSEMGDEEKKKYSLALKKNLNKHGEQSDRRIKEALFAIGEATSDTEKEMLKQLRDPSSNRTLIIANELIIKGVYKDEAKAVYLERIFNEKSPETAVKNQLPKLGVNIAFILPDILEGIEDEANQKVRQKALIYLIDVVNPYAFYHRSETTPYSQEEINNLSRIFEPYRERLELIAKKSKEEKGYIGMLFENLSWQVQ